MICPTSNWVTSVLNLESGPILKTFPLLLVIYAPEYLNEALRQQNHSLAENENNLVGNTCQTCTHF